MATERQLDGVAHVGDTITASAVVGFILGLTGYSAVSVRDLILLFAVIPAMLINSWILRSP